jgi:hypothetical protein
MKIRTFLISGAVAMAALTSVASAKKPIVLSIDGTCDVIQVRVIDKNLLAVSADQSSCENTLGGGFVLKDKVLGKAARVGFILDDDVGAHYSSVASYPFVTGGTVDIYLSDGTTMQLIASTTYTVVDSAARTPKGGKPLSALVRH